MTDYLTKIKTLEEHTRDMNVILDNDKQTVLCLAMTLPEHLQYFTKAWAVTPGMTAAKARNMLLKEERRSGNRKLVKVEAFAAVKAPGKRHSSRKSLEFSESGSGSGSGPCSKCEKRHKEEACWNCTQNLAPGWLQEKWQIEKKSRKGKHEDDEPEVWCSQDGFVGSGWTCW